MTAAPLIAVGEVLRPYGLRGEVKVRPMTDQPKERFGRLGDCYLWEPDSGWREPCRVAACRFEGDTVLVRLEGVDSPEAARAVAGRLLAVEREQALPAAPGRFYPWQMKGAAVQTRDGRTIGRFAGVATGGAQELWAVDDGEREHLIPAVPEIVLEVNVAERRIVIDPPEGLLEL